MRSLFALVLAVILLLGTAAPAAAYTAPDLSWTEEYVAFRVRIARGESNYVRRRADLTQAAQARAREISVHFSHDGWWDDVSKANCYLLGEIIGTSTIDHGRQAARYVFSLWEASPGHRALLHNTRDFNRWGVGAHYAGGRWYFVVTFGGGCV